MEFKRTREQFAPVSIEELVNPGAFTLEVYRNMPMLFGDHTEMVSVRERVVRIPLVEASLRSGKDFRREWRVDVGRADDNDVVLECDLVSGHHGSFVACMLQGRPAVYYVDRGSTNGSFLSGRRLTGGSQVVPGTDVVNVGRVYDVSAVPHKFEYDFFVQSNI